MYKRTNKTITDIFLRISKYIIHTAPWIVMALIVRIGVKILYWWTKEKGDKDGVLTKRKYRRIKQSVRYKLWIQKNAKWIFDIYGCDFQKYEKFRDNKQILKY